MYAVSSSTSASASGKLNYTEIISNLQLMNFKMSLYNLESQCNYTLFLLYNIECEIIYIKIQINEMLKTNILIELENILNTISKKIIKNVK